MTTMKATGAPTTDLRFPTGLSYSDRASKAPYIARKYAAILGGAVLDIGCDKRLLARHLPAGARYVGVDLAPPADVVLNLDCEDLPFEAGSFDTVVAADVLEHLDRLHAVFDRLCGIARRHVIVALPNPARTFVLGLAGGAALPMKHYGLPVEEPADRHRWFFGFEEAVRFLRERGGRNGFEVIQIDTSDCGTPPLTDARGRNVLDDPNLREGTLWCVLERRDAP